MYLALSAQVEELELELSNGSNNVFTPQEVADLPVDTTEYDWGYYYGTPVETQILLDFNDYYDEFIYDQDFLNANIIGVNAVVSYGVMIDNIFDEYPDAEYLEFYIITSQDNNHIYWRSLKVAFEKVGRGIQINRYHPWTIDRYIRRGVNPRLCHCFDIHS